MEKIGTGRTAEVFLTETHTVVKLFYDWVTPQHMENEVQRAKDISAIYPQAPRYISAGNWDGRYGLEMEYIPGEMGTEYLLHNALRIRQVLAKTAAVHKEMHRTFAPALPGQVEKFQDSLAACAYITKDTQAELLSFLAEREEMGFLCHGDFHPENILVTRDGQFRVIDWLDAYRGDPMGDVARTYYLLSKGESVQPEQSFGEKMLLRIRPMLAEQYFRLYYRGEKILEKNWLIWQLIIQSARIQEGIAAEMPRLHQSIRLLEKHLFARQVKN